MNPQSLRRIDGEAGTRASPNELIGKRAGMQMLAAVGACLTLQYACLAVAATNNPLPDPSQPSGNKTKTDQSFELRSLSYGGISHPLRLEPHQMPGRPGGDQVRVSRYAGISLTYHGETLGVSFGASNQTIRYATRLNYKLEGYDAEWRNLTQSSVHLVLKFLDSHRIPVSREEFLISGDSVGWTGDLATSSLSLRNGNCVVPQRAAWVDVWIDSGGHDETSGIWLIDDLRIRETDPADSSGKLLLDENFEEGTGLDTQQGDFSLWVRDGGALNGALVWSGHPGLGNHALLIMDSHPRDYAAWRLKDKHLLPVVPGRKLDLQWSEVFSIGAGRNGDVLYHGLPSGQYQFRVREVSATGVPTGEEVVLPLIIAPPFYANLWFRAALFVTLLSIVLGLERFAARKRMRRKLEALKHTQAVQQERARIARDIHDDLGTVLSRISMISESAALEAEPGSPQEQRLSEICETSRQLTRTMEEIVWAQDPKHDALDNMVSYFCSFASDLLGVARIACRLDIPIDLPNILLEAEQRHELFLVFKEVLNNIIKHSGASEVRISLRIVEGAIHLAIEDDGKGFQPSDSPFGKGNGLNNMKNRLQRISGTVEIESAPGKGTTVRITQPIRNQP